LKIAAIVYPMPQNINILAVFLLMVSSSNPYPSNDSEVYLYKNPNSNPITTPVAINRGYWIRRFLSLIDLYIS